MLRCKLPVDEVQRRDGQGFQPLCRNGKTASIAGSCSRSCPPWWERHRRLAQFAGRAIPFGSGRLVSATTRGPAW